MGTRVASALLLLAAAAPGARAEDPPAPAPPAAPAKEGAPVPAAEVTAKASPAGEIPWAKDLAEALVEAGKRDRLVLAVVLEDWYPSEPCRRLEEALKDPLARAAGEGSVPVRVVEDEKRTFSEARGLAGVGHPYTALLDAAGKPVAVLRGAWPAAAWAAHVRRLAAAAERWRARRSEAEKSPDDPKALFALSEALRDLGRSAEADDVLPRVERALGKSDPEGKSPLHPLVRFRRAEARVEDRMAVQDFEGARALLDAYEKEFPSSPHRRWVAFYRAVTQAYRGEPDPALETLREIAAEKADATLAALAAERVALIEKVVAEKAKK